MRHKLNLLLAAVSLLAACAGPTATPVTPTATPRPPTATPEPTARPNRLVICATEPEAASPFEASQAGHDLLALFYELPAERVGYRWEPRLLARLPSFATGEAVTRTVAVLPGRRYVDESGALQTNAGSTTLELPQLVVTFTLQADLRWSDGEPLTAQDVLLGYHLAQDAAAQGRWRDLAERTDRLSAIDALTLRWEGLPGFLSTDYPGFLFPPQPAHRWRSYSLTQVWQDKTPPANGPFMIEAWEAGKEVRLRRNPAYHGPSPQLDEVIFRFGAVAGHEAEALAAGTCDVLAPDPAMKIGWEQIATLVARGQAALWADVAPTFLRLDFNLAPADGRVTPLADLQVRQALAYCLDRSRLVQALAGQALLVAESFVPPTHPAFGGAELVRTGYDPQVGQTLLEQAGWRDEDQDGIREAHGVPYFKDGTPLSLTLYLAAWYTIPAAHISADLETCGVGVLPRPVQPEAFYAADPASPLAGRTFDLAFFGWQAEVPAVCGAWRSDRIPGPDNEWQGENFSGYISPEYEAACHRALIAVETADQWAALQTAQALLTRDLPTVFMVWRPLWFVARPKVQGWQPDASADSVFWNVEALSWQP